jgi:hypothetical protein
MIPARSRRRRLLADFPGYRSFPADRLPTDGRRREAPDRPSAPFSSRILSSRPPGTVGSTPIPACDLHAWSTTVCSSSFARNPVQTPVTPSPPVRPAIVLLFFWGRSRHHHLPCLYGRLLAQYRVGVMVLRRKRPDAERFYDARLSADASPVHPDTIFTRDARQAHQARPRCPACWPASPPTLFPQ